MHKLVNILRPALLWCNRWAFVGRALKPTSSIRMPSFSAFSFSPSINEYLQKKSLHTPSSIQQKSYTQLVRPTHHNYYIIAPTGSGKTLAYLLPIFNTLKEQQEMTKTKLTKPNRPRCLIVVSSKQLVSQVTEVCKGVTHFCKLKVLGLNRQRTEKEEREMLDQGADVVVTTLDRIAKLRDHLFLSYLNYLVIDQLDTLLDANNADILEELIEAVKIRQIKATDERVFTPKVILVSATFTKLIDKFFTHCFKTYERDRRFYTNDEWYTVENKPNPKQQFELKKIIDKNCHLNLQNIRHQFIHCKTLDKHQSLYSLLMQHKRVPILIFCNTVKSLHQLDYYLSQMKIPTTCLHGDLSRPMRKANIDKFNGKSVNIMLTTDLGSRGLDFPFLENVVNYDFPMTVSDYLHRAGRTGRAGRKGTVYTLYHQKNLEMINQLKASHDHNKPLDISSSAYSLSNKQDFGKHREEEEKKDEKQQPKKETKKTIQRKEVKKDFRSKRREKSTKSAKDTKVAKKKPVYAQKARRVIKRKQGKRKV